MTKSLFILCISILAVLGPITSSILTVRGVDTGASVRALSKEDRGKINNEKIRLVNEKMRDMFREKTRELLGQCLSLELVTKSVTRPRNKKDPAAAKKPLTSEERQALAQEAFHALQSNCIVEFFNGKGSKTSHPNWSQQKNCALDFFVFLHTNRHYTKECMDLSVELKNYNNMLTGLRQNLNSESFFMGFKNFYFKVADAVKMNEFIYRQNMIDPVLASTVVSINDEDGQTAGRYVSGHASGNLVNFDPATKRFSNLCSAGETQATVNYLLTALHCLNGWEQLIFTDKGNDKKASPAINVPKSIALIPTRIEIEAFGKTFDRTLKIIKNQNAAKGVPNQEIGEFEVQQEMDGQWDFIRMELKNLIMTEEKDRDDPRELRADIPFLSSGAKIAGEDFLVNLFQDKDQILVKLASPIVINCQGGKTLDFSNANIDQAARDQMLQAVRSKTSVMNLYGFPGSKGPFRIKMSPLKRKLFFADERPEENEKLFQESKEVAINSFVLNGAALNGASGGPLILEEQKQNKYIATVIRGTDHNLSDLEVKFNARKIE